MKKKRNVAAYIFSFLASRFGEWLKKVSSSRIPLSLNNEYNTKKFESNILSFSNKKVEHGRLFLHFIFNCGTDHCEEWL